jgi:hypothetical protein
MLPSIITGSVFLSNRLVKTPNNRLEHAFGHGASLQSPPRLVSDTISCELDSPQATDVGINRNELQPQNSPNKFGPQTFILSHAPDFHPE